MSSEDVRLALMVAWFDETMAGELGVLGWEPTRLESRCQRWPKIGSGPDFVLVASGEQDAFAE
jgi:hypothetical protein